MIRKSFLLAINNDNEPEGDETFRLILSEPTNGASLGNQWITQVRWRSWWGVLPSMSWSPSLLTVDCRL
jgi:hypothetical protein